MITDTQRRAAKKICKADESKEDIIVSVIPKGLQCEGCKRTYGFRYVYYLPKVNANFCPACTTLAERLLRDEELRVNKLQFGKEV